MSIVKNQVYWYEILTIICPICGKFTIQRTRIYGTKPTNGEQYKVSEEYDYCDEA